MATKRHFLALLFVAVCLGSPPVRAQEQLTGMYRLSRDTTAIVGPEMAAVLEEAIDKDEQLEWQVYIPESYSPDRPAGLFVYIDPNGYGLMPDQWQGLFAQRNLIWVGVRQTRRRSNDVRRVWQAILGSRAIAQDYAIDLQRMYVGGAQDTVAAALHTMLTANEFSGAIYIRGSYDAQFLDPDFRQAMRRKHHVFITGTNDKNKAKVRSDYEKYQSMGIDNVKLIFDTQRLEAVPKSEQIGEAFRYLDTRNGSQ